MKGKDAMGGSSEQRIHFFDAFFAHAVLILDTNKNVIDCNNRFHSMFGLDTIPAGSAFGIWLQIHSKDAFKHKDGTWTRIIWSKLDDSQRKYNGLVLCEGDDYILLLDEKTADNPDMATSVQHNQSDDTSKAQLSVLFDNMEKGVALYRLITDDKGHPVNYIVDEINAQYEKIFGFSRNYVIKKLATEVYGTKEAPYLKEFSKAVSDGKSYEFKVYFPPLKKYFKLSVTPCGEQKFGTVFCDITQQYTIEKELIKREKLLSKVFETIPIGLWYADNDGKLLVGNAAGIKIWGKESLVDMQEYGVFKARRYPSGEEIGPDDWALVKTIKDGVTIKDEVLEIDTFDNQKKIIVNYTAPFLNDEGEVQGAIVMNEDITERKKAEEELFNEKELLKTTLNSIGDGVVVTDNNGKITTINTVFEQLTSWPQSEAYGKDFIDVVRLINERTCKKCKSPVQKVLKTGKIIGLSNRTILLCKDGSQVPIAHTAAPIKDAQGNIQGVIIVIRNMTEESKKQKEIDFLVYHDSLTGLYNRRFFDNKLKELDKAENLPLSVMSCDVNGLKLTNDAFGHSVGDKLIKRMAKTISRACRAQDIVARSGGDEFIVLMPHADEKQAIAMCKTIKQRVSKVKIDAVDFSLAVGYETKTQSDVDIAMTIKKAEDYMYRNKSYESRSMRGSSINTILLTLHEKNPRERLHSNRVSDICKQIAGVMRLTTREINDIGIIGLMHDIGKIAIEENILNKNGKLTDDEWLEIKRHPEIGYRILSASQDMAHIANIVLSHHERFDGGGYPNGLKKDEIPLIARIVAVADSYDAMTSDRPYRKAMPKEKAIKEVVDNAGTQFDPEIVAAFCYLHMED